MAFETGLENGAARGMENAAFRRIAALFDDGAFTQLDSLAKNGDGPAEAVTGFGYVEGNPVYAFSQDGSVNGGAMSLAQAAKISRIYDLAVKTGAPVVGIYDSAGAHLIEGAGTMAAFGELILQSNRLSGVVPQIAVIAGSCGGSSAVLAALSDIVVMSGEASFFLTPPSLLEEGAGSAALAAANGTAHLIAENDTEALASARRLLSLLPVNNLSVAQRLEVLPPQLSAAELTGGASLDALLGALADADSLCGLSAEYAPELRTALAAVGGVSVGIVGTDRAQSGKLSGAAAKKAARFVRFCDAFSLPVLTLIDTDGFEASLEAEQNALLRDAASLAHAYSEATCPKISLVFGSAVGPAFSMLAGRASGADLVFAWPEAVISSLAPETAVSILWNDRIAAGEKRPALTEEYKATLGSAAAAAAGGYLDDIISPEETLSRLTGALELLSAKRVATHPKKHSNLPL